LLVLGEAREGGREGVREGEWEVANIGSHAKTKGGEEGGASLLVLGEARKGGRKGGSQGGREG